MVLRALRPRQIRAGQFSVCGYTMYTSVSIILQLSLLPQHEVRLLLLGPELFHLLLIPRPVLLLVLRVVVLHDEGLILDLWLHDLLL